MNNKLVVFCLTFVFVLTLLFTFGPEKKHKNPKPQRQPAKPLLEPTTGSEIHVSTLIPSYLNYNGIIRQLQQWDKEAPSLTEVGQYGTTTKGVGRYYIRVTNEKITHPKQKVLITACIHGNEPLSTSVVMGCIGTILYKFSSSSEMADLLDKREIYFVPVVSPNSYPKSRHVHGVDPNRNFPTHRNPDKVSVPPVKDIKNFMVKHKFDAVISGHTWGRVYLYPWGCQRAVTSHQRDYDRILGEMCRLSGYRKMPIHKLYGTPIYGTEADWYYHQGAFAIVMEFGEHQKIPTREEILIEFNKTFEAIIYFAKEAPLVEIN